MSKFQRNCFLRNYCLPSPHLLGQRWQHRVLGAGQILKPARLVAAHLGHGRLVECGAIHVLRAAALEAAAVLAVVDERPLGPPEAAAEGRRRAGHSVRARRE